MIDEASTEELHELQLDYLNDAREKVEVMRQQGKHLLARKHFKTSFPLLLFLSHQLKGSGGSLGFPEISSLAEKMNQELNRFIDADAEPRMSRQQLSSSIISMADALHDAIGRAEAQVTG